MQEYRSNKLRTVRDIVSRIENWPTAVGMRLHRNGAVRLRLLSFRNGLEVVCRTGTRDWDVIHELLFADGYSTAFQYLAASTEPGCVLDLGGNLGLFSLLSAKAAPERRVFAYEPGPPNARLFEMNCRANPALGVRIDLRPRAVAGTSREDDWFFDEANPGGSGLFAREGKPTRVKIDAFAEVVASLEQPVVLAKIDIEGAEYELLEKTPASVWEGIRAISLELHDDPSGKMTQAEFLDRMRALGYTVKEETVCSYFLQRS